ncbi:MAG: hypothetical protein ABRQ38_12350 [Candidatus Eremiobacterota bacterium]
MNSPAIATVIKMMESLPEHIQEQLVEHLRDYLEGISHELRWEVLFKQNDSKLIAAARRAKQEIAEGLAIPMEHNKL